MADNTPVGDMPRMVPDRDDIRSRSQSKGQPATERNLSPTPPERTRSGHNWVLVSLVIISGIGIGYLALQQYSLTQLLTSYEERLELADERIVGLERSLTETDESVAMNGTAINAQFKAIKSDTDMNMSEIRKLWDVTNKRNRNWIEENQSTLEAQKQNLDSAMASLAKVIDTQEKDAVVIGDMNSVLSKNQTTFAELETSLGELTTNMETMTQSIKGLLDSDLEEQLLSLTLQQENMLAEQSNLSASADSNAEQITQINKQLEAIDASRLETSRRLNALTGQIETLTSRLTALTGG